jgi:hypothetical protein
MSRTWKCRQCGLLQARDHRRKCEECGTARPVASRRGKPIEDYAFYCRVAEGIHHYAREQCCACGRDRKLSRQHDRDHDHVTKRPRGLLCGGDAGCNVLLAKWVTAKVARSIADTKLVWDEPDSARWHLLANYLERVDAYYQWLSAGPTDDWRTIDRDLYVAYLNSNATV